MSQPEDYVSVEELVPPKRTMEYKVQDLIRRFYEQPFKIKHVVALAMRERTFKGYAEEQVYEIVKKKLSNLAKENKVTRASYGNYINTGGTK